MKNYLFAMPIALNTGFTIDNITLQQAFDFCELIIISDNLADVLRALLTDINTDRNANDYLFVVFNGDKLFHKVYKNVFN